MAPGWLRPTTVGARSPEPVSTSAPAIKLAVDELSFDEEVILRSHEIPVVVDFWAAWCGPCRQLGPVLEGAVEELAGQVLLRQLDVDANPGLAQRYSVRGIPAVKAFRAGAVSAEFVGAQPGPAVRAFLRGLLPSPADELVERGDVAALRQALELDPSHLPARRALARALIANGEWAEAERVALQAPQDRLCDGLAAWADLGQEPDPSPAGQDLLSQLEAGDYARAVDLAVNAVGAATGPRRDLLRRIALYCFEVLGPEHPAALAGRSRLAAALY
jgi:putative thioredoxin